MTERNDIAAQRKNVKRNVSPRYEKSSRRTAFNKSFPPVPITIRLQRFGLPIAGGATITLGGGGTLSRSFEHNAAGTDDRQRGHTLTNLLDSRNPRPALFPCPSPGRPVA